MNFEEEALRLHQQRRGKIEVRSKVPLATMEDFSIYYTPGVAAPCQEIARNPKAVDEYTSRGNMIPIVSDGSRVLGLGNLGPKAALPVMEGKAIIFKALAGVDAFPICLDTQEPDEIVRAVELLEPTFGGISLEDIASPKCFSIEQDLKQRMEIPVLHDDQHCTAVAVLAALMNANIITGLRMQDLNVLICGVGAAGTAVAKLLLDVDVGNIVLCDSRGVVSRQRKDLTPVKRELAEVTNKDGEKGILASAFPGKNVFIGVSVPAIVSGDMIASMAEDSVVFALANPIPEILPEEAKAQGARIVGTGRSDFANQVNNALVFPGIFRGALDVKARDINEPMKLAAAQALAGVIHCPELNEDCILPTVLDRRVVPAVAEAVARAAIASGVAREPDAPLRV